MASVTIGQKGCLNADLVLAQSQSFGVTVTHENKDGTAIDHTGESGYCRLQRKGKDDVVLDEYVTVGETVEIAIPGSVTAQIETGSWNWDLFVGDTRLLYGKCEVFDTYARDDG